MNKVAGKWYNEGRDLDDSSQHGFRFVDHFAVESCTNPHQESEREATDVVHHRMRISLKLAKTKA